MMGIIQRLATRNNFGSLVRWKMPIYHGAHQLPCVFSENTAKDIEKYTR